MIFFFAYPIMNFFPEYPPSPLMRELDHLVSQNRQLIAHQNHPTLTSRLSSLQKKAKAQSSSPTCHLNPTICNKYSGAQCPEKKPRYSDNSPLQYTSTLNSSTPSTHCITSLFGPNPNINIQPPVPEEPFNPNIDTPDSVYISYYCAWLYSYKMYIENCFMYTRK